MKFMLCPQCGISNFFIKNEKGERLNVKVTRDLQIIPKDNIQSLGGFDQSMLFCLGCSWYGNVNQLKKYLV